MGIRCTCQHGPLECEKNSLQSCVISYFPETDTHLEIVNCIQGASEFDESVQKCLVEHKPPLRVPSDRLVRCALSDGGRSLMGYHGVVQHYRASRLQWVPWIVINGVRDNEAERDLKRVLCTRYLKPRPSICEAYPIDPTEPI
ncbi:hypothetical protein DICVIV_04461 [Dictyocaulus viviparus]|uniref:Gamma interferon inducible lysosomal thiol reductase n=1 Tax=Dictyocaulus viviparus TaxID=29172 RepID=A0A0D8Y091_DICVI|nr:hypothetical protein DICVIV_04461 [Dictyocaulus viviparus]